MRTIEVKFEGEDMETKSLFVYPKQAQEILGVGTTKFYELNKLPDFPKAKNPLGKRNFYLRSELEDWAKKVK